MPNEQAPLAIEHLDMGRALPQINEALRDVFEDMRDRPRLSGKRVLTITVTVTPPDKVRPEEPGWWPTVGMEISRKVPPDVSGTTTVILDKQGAPVVNLMDRDPRQGVLDNVVTMPHAAQKGN